MQTFKNLAIRPFIKSIVWVFFSTSILLSPIDLLSQQAVAFDTHLLNLVENERTHLTELAFNEQTTAFVNSSSTNIVGIGSATTIDVNAADFSFIDFTSVALSQVEFIRIRVNNNEELSQTFNCTSAASLGQLKCVLVECSLDIAASQLINMVQGLQENVTACYSISVPK
jgi:hypothetical protein